MTIPTTDGRDPLVGWDLDGPFSPVAHPSPAPRARTLGLVAAAVTVLAVAVRWRRGS